MQFLFQCSKKCGRGGQTRLVKCVHVGIKKFVSENNCKQSDKPRAHQKCKNQDCTFLWATGDWSEVTNETLRLI